MGGSPPQQWRAITTSHCPLHAQTVTLVITLVQVRGDTMGPREAAVRRRGRKRLHRAAPWAPVGAPACAAGLGVAACC